MKKIITITAVLFFIGYILYQNGSLWLLKILSLTSANTPISFGSNSQNFASLTPPFKNGIYTGHAEDAFYGTIQVQAIIQQGKISDIKFLQYPNDRTRSIAINTLAMPNLKQEAIQSQSAQVDVVSGATDSSMAFVQSLGSALSKAK